MLSSPSELAFEVPFPLTMSLPLRTAISLPSVAFGLQTSDSLAPVTGTADDFTLTTDMETTAPNGTLTESECSLYSTGK